MSDYLLNSILNKIAIMKILYTEKEIKQAKREIISLLNKK